MLEILDLELIGTNVQKKANIVLILIVGDLSLLPRLPVSLVHNSRNIFDRL